MQHNLVNLDFLDANSLAAGGEGNNKDDVVDR